MKKWENGFLNLKQIKWHSPLNISIFILFWIIKVYFDFTKAPEGLWLEFEFFQSIIRTLLLICIVISIRFDPNNKDVFLSKETRIIWMIISFAVVAFLIRCILVNPIYQNYERYTSL